MKKVKQKVKYPKIQTLKIKRDYSDSNSLGGILGHSHDEVGEMPDIKPRTKAAKGDQLTGELKASR